MLYKKHRNGQGFIKVDAAISNAATSADGGLPQSVVAAASVQQDLCLLEVAAEELNALLPPQLAASAMMKPLQLQKELLHKLQ